MLRMNSKMAGSFCARSDMGVATKAGARTIRVAGRPEGVGRQQVDLDVTPDAAEPVGDAVDQDAVIGERAVDVEQQVLELDRFPPRDLDAQAQASGHPAVA